MPTPNSAKVSSAVALSCLTASNLPPKEPKNGSPAKKTLGLMKLSCFKSSNDYIFII